MATPTTMSEIDRLIQEQNSLFSKATEQFGPMSGNKIADIQQGRITNIAGAPISVNPTPQGVEYYVNGQLAWKGGGGSVDIIKTLINKALNLAPGIGAASSAEGERQAVAQFYGVPYMTKIDEENAIRAKGAPISQGVAPPPTSLANPANQTSVPSPSVGERTLPAMDSPSASSSASSQSPYYGKTRDLAKEQQTLTDITKFLNTQTAGGKTLFSTVSQANLPTLVNAVLYGGYSLQDVANDLYSRATGGQGGIVHPTIPRDQWVNNLAQTGALTGGQSSSGGSIGLTGTTSAGQALTGSAGSATTAEATDPATLMLNQIESYLKELEKRGQTINPDVQITPEKAAEFMAQAQREIDPYYSSQLKIAREGFLKSIGYTTDQIATSEKEMEKKYGQAVRQVGSNMAETGMVLSGERNLQEQDLAQETQSSMEQARKEASYNAGNAARNMAQQWGASAIDSIPQISNAPRVLAGAEKFQSTGSSSPFYELSPEVYSGLIGSQEWQKKQDIASRSSQLESGWRQNEYLKQARTLNI